ncbi:unnamed protein product, partial [Mesocestoides corti]
YFYLRLIVLQDGIKDHFKSVNVRIVPCPDLKASPFRLLCSGLSGQNIVCDVGGMSYLLPVPDKTKMAANVRFEDSKISSNSTLHGVYDESTRSPQVLAATDNNFALLAHLLATEGLPGDVIEVDASGRLKEGAPYVFLREALTSAYGKLDKPVALGGVFMLTGSKGRFHVLFIEAAVPLLQPDFPDHPVDSPSRVAEFLKFFEMEPPVMGMGTLVSHDPFGIDLKLDHFHCYNEKRDLAGHFYWDTEPQTAHYKFYLTVAKSLLRIDPKPK